MPNPVVSSSTHSVEGKSDGQGGFPIQKLPKGVLDMIFRYVPIREGLKLRLVCKQWEQLLSKDWFWKPIYLNKCFDSYINRVGEAPSSFKALCQDQAEIDRNILNKKSIQRVSKLTDKIWELKHYRNRLFAAFSSRVDLFDPVSLEKRKSFASKEEDKFQDWYFFGDRLAILYEKKFQLFNLKQDTMELEHVFAVNEIGTSIIFSGDCICVRTYLEGGVHQPLQETVNIISAKTKSIKRITLSPKSSKYCAKMILEKDALFVAFDSVIEKWSLESQKKIGNLMPGDENSTITCLAKSKNLIFCGKKESIQPLVIFDLNTNCRRFPFWEPNLLSIASFIPWDNKWLISLNQHNKQLIGFYWHNQLKSEYEVSCENSDLMAFTFGDGRLYAATEQLGGGMKTISLLSWDFNPLKPSNPSETSTK